MVLSLGLFKKITEQENDPPKKPTPLAKYCNRVRLESIIKRCIAGSGQVRAWKEQVLARCVELLMAH